MAKEWLAANCNEYSSLLRKVTGVNLFAAEAQFHRVCLNNFYSKHQTVKGYHKSTDIDEVIAESETFKLHKQAYSAVKMEINQRILVDQEVLSLTIFKDAYILELRKLGVMNPSYRTEKLYIHLLKDEELSKQLSFSKVLLKGCVSSWLVYSSKLSLDKAISSVYKLASNNKLKETALHLRESIQKAFKNSTDLPWPPTSDDIENRIDEIIPEELNRFLKLVISSSESTLEVDKNQRLVSSIGQDICRAVTNGHWKLPKHILLCNTIRHLYRRKQLATVMNRLGHCESCSFGEELETAMAEAIEESNTHISPQIQTGACNIVFHSAWDLSLIHI